MGDRSVPAHEPVAVTSEDRKGKGSRFSFTDPQKISASNSVVKEPSVASPAPQQAGPDDSGWEFSVAPYLFMAGISGTLGAGGNTIEVDSSFGNIWDNLDVGLMSTVEAHKGKFISLNDLAWIKLSKGRDTPGGGYSNAKLGLNIFIFDPEVGYRVLDKKAGTLDVVGGVRIWSVESNLNVTSGILPGFDVSKRKTWAAPVVGVRGLANLSSRFFLTGKFDIGGAGIGADLTTQLFGAAGYRLTKNIAIIGGYRWLQVDYDDSKGFIFDTQMSGLMIGAKFTF
jgi:hypothetical protein